MDKITIRIKSTRPFMSILVSKADYLAVYPDCQCSRDLKIVIDRKSKRGTFDYDLAKFLVDRYPDDLEFDIDKEVDYGTEPNEPPAPPEPTEPTEPEKIQEQDGSEGKQDIEMPDTLPDEPEKKVIKNDKKPSNTGNSKQAK